ncbi:recombination regulator RecX [Corynebacterium aquilae]|uniref:Regulatory protein RecX n=1 Tax=Corynebacterium aquilae DSM 44791 TaxID=1431546 RepID=A0A1L7CGD7_9CORY|nr:recombination regulator RecX [Corynebacterium aquilae]APT84930.1 hypothetical protein CAQU_07470 [Corynebacterium aquilae DSM 44791]
MATAVEPQQQRIAALKEAIENFAQQEQSTFFDAQWEEEKAKVRSRALKILDHRPRSVGELSDRLRDLDFPAALVDEVIADLRRVGLLDDEEFARQWVRQRHMAKGKSRAVLRQELREKKVPADAAEQALSLIDDEDESAVATRLAQKKAAGVKKPPEDYQEYTKYLRRIVGVLARRGYSQSLALSVARTCLDQRIEELGATPGNYEHS